MSEVWDLYDAEMNRTGETMFRGEEVPAGRMHLVVDALFLNSRGETLLQRRADDKDILPGFWSVTGGSALAGETGREACDREVREEMGFAPDWRNARLLCRRQNPEKGWFREVYLFLQDVSIDRMHLQAEEVQDAQWFLPESIRADAELWRQLNVLSFWNAEFPYLMLESMRLRIPEGTYRHYKGNRYQVKGLALHSETLEPMVIYQALYGHGETWVRPASMWNEEVNVNGTHVRRFQME